MVNKKTFKPFRLEELTGGINVRDSASEIEDKQAVDIVNWNFKGNRLVNEKGIEDSGNGAITEIGGMTIDSGDIWTVSKGSVYKNNIVVDDGVGIIVKTNKTSFKPGVIFNITIDGNDYEISGLTVEEFVLNLQTAVEADGLETLHQDDLLLIKRSDGTPITYSVTSNTSYVIYNNFNFATSPYVYGIDYVWKIRINGVDYQGVYTMSEEYLNQGQVDIELMEDIYNALPSSISKSLVYLDSNFDKVSDYTSYSGIIINNIDTSNTELELREFFYKNRLNSYSPSAVSYKFIYDLGLTIEGTTINGIKGYIAQLGQDNSIRTYNFSITIDGNTYTYNNSVPASTVIPLVVNWINSLSGYTAESKPLTNDIVFYKTANGGSISFSHTNGNPGTTIDVYDNTNLLSVDSSVFPETLLRDVILTQINGISGLTAEENSSTGVLGIHIKKNEYEQITYTADGQVVFNEIRFLSEDIRLHTYDETIPEVEVLTAGTGLNGRANITIGNLGALIVDKDEGGAFYSFDGMNIKISPDSIGQPTVGTIYNGKIILGGYEDNDNIIFSKTSSPTQPLNVLNFTDYSAGGQSVSGGDKGLVTGMMVGENGLYVFKDNSVWYTNSEVDNPSSFSFNFRFNKITSNGALSQNVITEVDQEIFYLDWKSREVRRLGYEQNLTTLRDVAISREMSDLFKLLPEEQPLATSHFSYPNYKLSLSDGQSPTVEYNNGNSYHTNNKHFIYNVENKSWTTRDGIDGLIVSDKGHFADSNGLVYKDFEGSTSSTGTYLSKEYVFDDDIQYKKFGRFEVIGNIKSSVGNVKQLKVVIIIDDEEIDERIIEANGNELIQIREKIDMYDIGQKIQFKLEHSGVGEVEVHDVQIYYKRTSIQPQDYN